MNTPLIILFCTKIIFYIFVYCKPTFSRALSTTIYCAQICFSISTGRTTSAHAKIPARGTHDSTRNDASGHCGSAHDDGHEAHGLSCWS
jgi:hypothetical protein